jgi:acylphosphatase
MHSCYNVKITGKVQDIGFRSIIENIAILHDLKGFVLMIQMAV